MRILLIDNFDSFTYNLVHYLQQVCNHEIYVVRNDAIALDEVNLFDKILISPGPGLPVDAGVTMNIIQKYSKTKNILGVCLGHQAIAQNFGARLKNLPVVSHGIASTILVKEKHQLFNGLPDAFEVGRYHSWVVDESDLPEDLIITAVDDAGLIMALKHKNLDIHGVQFHPESIMTTHGLDLLRNWVE